MKSTKGITLVALIITIIILLILAGISISSLLGSGLFENAKKSKQQYTEKEAKEKLELVLSDAQILKNSDEGLDDEKLDEELSKIGKIDNGDNTNVTVNGYKYKIDRERLVIVDYLGIDGEEIEADKIRPTVDSVNVEVDGLKIKISAVGTDNESGLKQFNYIITPSDGLSEDEAVGKFAQGEFVEVTSTLTEKEYEISVVAEDNAGNLTETPVIKNVVTNTVTVAYLKKNLNASTLRQYQGVRVDYNPVEGGTWRVFYCDDGTKFGDTAGLIYLKRDYDGKTASLSHTLDEDATATGIEYMKKINPDWRDSENGKEVELDNEKAVAWLCDINNWTNYIDEGALYAVGAPSVEMYVKAYNAYYGENSLNCKIDAPLGKSGYLIGMNNSYDTNSGYTLAENVLKSGPNGIFFPGDYYMWLASPSATGNSGTYVLCVVGGTRKTMGAGGVAGIYSYAPMVCIPK